MTTAQEQLRSMLREDVAPALRAVGFRGTERRFTLPDPNWFAQIGVQTSASSTAERSKLTIRVQLISKSRWAQAREERGYYPVKPSPHTNWGRAGEFWQVRAGQLIDGQDRWWILDARGIGRRKLAAELNELIIDIVLPEMRRRMASGDMTAPTLGVDHPMPGRLRGADGNRSAASFGGGRSLSQWWKKLSRRAPGDRGTEKPDPA